MKVVITDYTFPSLEIEEAILRPLAELRAGQCKTPAALIELVRDADAVITQFAPVNADVIAEMNKARVIVRYGIGVDNVDLAAAKQKNIPVCNVPDYCIDEVADHTLAFILGLTRNVVANCTHLRGGKWGLGVPLSQMRTLRDLTVGIVGFGRIGWEVAARLGPFRCRRLVHDPVVAAKAVEQAGCEPVELPKLLADADVVTLHCPSTKETRRMINAQSLSRMKAGSLLINLARGDLVDTPALIQALQSGHLGGAALDVFDPEPLPSENPLLRMDNVIVASHIASTSPKAIRLLRETAANIAAQALRGEKLPNIVNDVIQHEPRRDSEGNAF